MLVRIFLVLSRSVNSSFTSFKLSIMGETRLTLTRLSWPSTKRSLFNRKDSLISLLILFLNTASPTCLRTVTAMRFDSSLFLWMRREKWFVSEHFTHLVFLKSPLLSRSSFVRVKEVIRNKDQRQALKNMLKTNLNSLHWNHLKNQAYTVRLFLPFARRLRITSLPDAVLILTRKPCVLFLLLL
jgi:hypothetical protein